jgi:outer membrane biosynthesis protein TonB
MSTWTDEEAPQIAAHPAAPDPDTLVEFEASRRPIVLSYCSWLCDPARADEAADAAFAALERRLESSHGGRAVDIDRALREATREAVAECMPEPVARGSRLRRLSGRDATCDLMPRLLGARASAQLSPADAERAARHLDRCWGCKALERRHTEAERGYDGLLSDAAMELALLERDGGEIRVTRAEGPVEERPPVEDPPVEDPPVEEPPVVEPPPVEEPPVEPPPVEEPPVEPPPVEARSEEPVEWPQDAAEAHAYASPTPRRSHLARPGLLVAVVALVVAAAALIAIVFGGSNPSDAGRKPTRATPAAQPAAPTASQRAAARRAAARQRFQARLAGLGDRLLGPGATGDDVKALQRLVGVPVTGAYGPETSAAVLDFQTANGLHADGNAGAETKRLLARRPPRG